MTLTATEVNDARAIAELHDTLAVQKAAFAADIYPPLELRKDRLHALIAGILGAKKRMRAALTEDFAVHHELASDVIEVIAPIGRALHAIERLDDWASEEARQMDVGFYGTAWGGMRYQPKGVIGNMLPWNFPFEIGLGALVEMLAAGNRVILKPSELAPACGEVMADMIGSTFDRDLVSTAVGGRDLAIEFASLQWDHLMFTGGPTAGRAVAVSAARNLVPTTLELGGKSPAIIAPGQVSSRAVQTILATKLTKSGQVCVAPDYVFVQRDDLPKFVSDATAWMQNRLPTLSSSQNATGIISNRHLDRLEALLQEARDAGTAIVQLGGEIRRQSRQMPLFLALDPAPSLRIMTEEIFGPILPVVPYGSLGEALERVNAGDRPLALYAFSDDIAEAEAILAATTSGGACINACAVHAQNDIGFGGSGMSGYGMHHGPEGFKEFSNHRGTFIRGPGDTVEAFMPPYGEVVHNIVSQTYAALEPQ